MRITKILSMLLVAFISSFFFVNNVNAYITSVSDPATNTFTISQKYTDTYTYILNYVNGETTNLGSKTINAFPGETINIDTPNVNVSQYTLNNITINGSGSYNIGDTYTQPNSNLAIVYNYNAPARTFNVTYSGENYSHSGGNSAIEGQTYTTRITVDNNYNLSSYSIEMNGHTLSSNEYTFNQNNGNLSIPNVSGNITITINTQSNGGCLIEGTQVMLWDGSTKNIEDITYNDLLKAWNHETGTYGYEYPAWLENEGTIDHYTKVTFSDGTELKVAIDHRLFSKRLNRYVNINSGDLQIGDEVVSLQGGVSYVTVTSIEEVNEEVRYYDIISTRYFNVIANGLLTTYEINNDISSNYKGFTDRMIWASQTPEDRLLSYEELINTFGYVDKYLYKTLKLADFKYAVEEGFITQAELIEIINKFMMNDNYRYIPPKDEFGNYLWMVTTSDDENINSLLHQMVEGETFIVPTPKNEENFAYWYNHSDNKHYQPGDEIEVDSSMYLEAIYN